MAGVSVGKYVVVDEIVGFRLGSFVVGSEVGSSDGLFVGFVVGSSDGSFVGCTVGFVVGATVGLLVGSIVGSVVGSLVVCGHCLDVVKGYGMAVEISVHVEALMVYVSGRLFNEDPCD